MPTDEVLIRDSCAKSRSNIKKYFYYNEYSKDNFPFKSNFEELTLLDMMEGTKSIIDVLPMFVPYILIIILAIICIGVWISVCCCSIKPRCCLKKDNKNTNRTRFICFMIFSGFSLSIIVLGIVLLVYISYAVGDFNGSICSLLMLQYEITSGQGFLAKNKLSKPFWYGSNSIGNSISDIKNLLKDLKTVCTGNSFGSTYTTCSQTGTDLENILQNIYLNKKDEKIDGQSPSGVNTQTIPIYISNLGPKENNETYTGRVYEGYTKNFKYILDDVLEPVSLICAIMTTDGGDSLSSGLEGFESVISSLDTMLENLSSTITTYITKYSNYIINFGYKFNFSLIAIITASMVIECILFIIYYFRPFSTIKCNIYIFINLINLVLILCIIFNGVFGILSLLIGNLADIVDAVLSNENFAAEKPRLVGEGADNIKKLSRCLRGDGDLFDEFVTDDVKSIVDPLTRLYKLYTPVKTIDEKINNDEEKTEYNSLIELDKVITELKEMKEDFILTTTRETSGNNDINTMLDELAKYTMAGRNYQIQCAQATYDIWTTSSEHCPSVQAGNNIITQQCKLLNEYYDPVDPDTKAQQASNIYNQACPLINTHTFPDVKSAVYKYILTLSNYRKDNEDKINELLGTNINANLLSEVDGFISLNNYFKNKFIVLIKPSISTINEKITGKVYTLFNELLNDTTQDTSKLNSNNFNLFSWMNCSAIGQNYNATLSTLKSNLTNEMRVITICSLICEFLLIANLYIMVGLAKNLRDKVFEINDARNVSHSSDNIEEIEVNSIKPKKPEKEDDEIYAIKNKKKFDVVQNVDTKRGINVDEDLNTDGNGIVHPAIVSINGPDGRCLFENGENAHNKMNSNKNNNINKEDKETEDGVNIKKSDNKLKVKESVEKKNLPNKKKDIISSDEEESDEESSSKQTKNTKSKVNKSVNKLKSSKSIKKEDKKSEASSSSVSFG